MAVVKWDPFRDVEKLQNRINRMFEDSFGHSRSLDDEMSLCAWRPAVDIYEVENGIVLAAELPGVGKSLRNSALESVGNVRWIPAWGQKRIEGMLESRPDWCISRQRSWGLPIPVFVNSEGQALLSKESVLAVAKRIGEKGSNCWFTDSPRELLGEDFNLPDGFHLDDLQKEENIFDVWFESGCS